MSSHCRLCGHQATIRDASPDSNDRLVTCRTCGTYVAPATTWAKYEGMGTEPTDRHLLSALTRTAPLREVGPLRIDDAWFKKLREGGIRLPTFTERRDALLDWLAFESRKRPTPYSAEVQVNAAWDYPVAYCRPVVNGENSEWLFIYKQLLDPKLVTDSGIGRAQITPAGWQLLESRPKASGALGFVAMAFKDMDDVRDAIEAGITAAGYKPLRIDGDHYIGGVMDRIIAKIRESRFVVADFTGNRGGVYYEAGFAFGLNVPVFTLCRRDHLSGQERIHFDVQHLNLLAWEAAKLGKLKEDLEARIVAVLGRGPLQQPG